MAIGFESNPQQALASEKSKAGAAVGRVRVPSLVELLRETLAGVEASKLAQPDDAVFIDLKQNLVRAIADLEVVKSDKERCG